MSFRKITVHSAEANHRGLSGEPAIGLN